MPLWVHRENEEAPERPFVFVLDVGGGPRATAPVNRGALQVVRHSGPAPASLPASSGPQVEYAPGRHALHLVLDRSRPVAVTAELTVS